MILDKRGYLLFERLRHLALADLVKDLLTARGEVLLEAALPLGDFVGGYLVDKTSDTGKDDGDLNLSGHRGVLTLLEQFSQASSTLKRGSSRRI